MALERIQHNGAAAVTTITGSITTTSTSIGITSSSGWPDGSVGPFYAVLDAGTASEEKILVASRSGTTLTLSSSASRGVDGTTATSHTATTGTIAHCYTAAEADDDNDHVYTTTRNDHTQYLDIAGSNATVGTWTPTWSGPGTPVLGNGTLVGHYTKFGKVLFFNIVLTPGSTTNSSSASVYQTWTLPTGFTYNSYIQAVNLTWAESVYPSSLGGAEAANGVITGYPVYIVGTSYATAIAITGFVFVQ